MMTFVSSYKPGITLEEKWQEGLPMLSRGIPGYKSISTTAFTTSKGLKGIKHIYTFTAGEYDMRAVVYTFLTPAGYSVTITCGVLARHGSTYDKIFDESAATLEITR
jgi:hypothetical protein